MHTLQAHKLAGSNPALRFYAVLILNQRSAMHAGLLNSSEFEDYRPESVGAAEDSGSFLVHPRKVATKP